MKQTPILSAAMRRVCALAAGMLLCAATLAADLPDAAELRARLAAGEHRQVFEELRPLEFEFAGQPQYDYLFGVAALRAGEVNIAAFVLERVVAVNPGHIGAAFELAQTEILLGKTRRGLEALRELFVREDVPAEQRILIAARIRAVEAARQARARAAYLEKFGWHGRVSAGFGRTDNARYAPGDSELAIFNPLLPDIIFTPPGEQPVHASYAESSALLEYRIPRGQSGQIAIGAQFFSRDYQSGGDADASNYRSGGPFVSAGFTDRQVRYGASVFAERVASDNDWRHDVIRGELSALTPLGKESALRGAIGYRHLEGRGDVSDRRTPSASVAFIWALHPDAVLHLQARVSDEDRKNSAGSDGDKFTRAISAALSHSLPGWKNLSATAQASFQSSRYQKPSTQFPGALRRDYTNIAVASLDWAADKDIHILPELAYARARSTIRDYEYVRREFRLIVRLDF